MFKWARSQVLHLVLPMFWRVKLPFVLMDQEFFGHSLSTGSLIAIWVFRRPLLINLLKHGGLGPKVFFCFFLKENKRNDWALD